MQYKSIVASLTKNVIERGVPPVQVVTSIPPSDDDPDINAEVLGYAEGQSFVIEYTDSVGISSVRRITVFEIVEGRTGIPSLMAKCHERKATRQFRVDRIRSCIDFDGEVHEDVPKFLSENFGMSISLATRNGKNDANTRWADIRDFIKPDAVVLSALSHSDGYVHQLERQGIEQHLTLIAERSGWHLTNSEIATISRFVERLRPTENSIERALGAIAKREPNAIMRLLREAIAVIDADGRRHPEEIAMLDDFCFELTGVHIASG